MKTIYRYSFLVGSVILIIVGINGCRPAEIPATLAAATPTPTNTAIPTPTTTPTLTRSPTLTPSPTATLLPPDVLAKMNDIQKLDKAPIDPNGNSKAEVYKSGSLVIYRDSNKALQDGYDLSTGEWLNQEQVYDTMLQGAGLTPENTWDTAHINDSTYKQREFYTIFPDPETKITETIIIDGFSYTFSGRTVIFYDINKVDGKNIVHKVLVPFQVLDQAGKVLFDQQEVGYGADFPKSETVYEGSYLQEEFVSGFEKGTRPWYVSLPYYYFGSDQIDARMRSGEIFKWPDNYIMPTLYWQPGGPR